MTKKKRFRSLRAKLFYTLLASGTAAVATFFLIRAGADRLIDTYYYSASSYEQREMSYAKALSQYVRENRVASTDTRAIGQWCAQVGDLYVLFYNSVEDAYGTDWWSVDADGSVYRSDASAAPMVYEIPFTDGVKVAEVLDYSISRFYTVRDILAMAFACGVLILGLLWYNRYVTRTAIRLCQQVREVSGGRIHQEIRCQNSDELGELAQETDTMRRAILGRIEKEKLAYQANSDLLTAISHDIRTPLTALIGYLDLAVGGQYDSQEQLEAYLKAGQEKAMRLKELTERLFRYFLVFGSRDETFQMQEYQARPLLEQLLGEPVAQLQMKGFKVYTAPLKEECWFRADMAYFKRVFDNLFSNVEKYADKGRPAAILAELEGDDLHICVSNWIPERPQPVESTKIGLKTCQKIMERLGGRLVVVQEKGQFVAEVILPASRRPLERA